MTLHQINIIKQYREGRSLRQIAHAHGISFQRVHAIILELAPEILRAAVVPPEFRWRGGGKRGRPYPRRKREGVAA